MCVDNRAINKVTIKYRFPIPCLDDMLDQLEGSKLFRKLTFAVGITRFGSDQGISGRQHSKAKTGYMSGWSCCSDCQTRPTLFMRVMKKVLRHFVGKFVFVYFDDILIYSKTED